MSLYEQLHERQEQENPVRFGVVSAGKFAPMFLAQVLRIAGVNVVGVADLQIDVAKSNIVYAVWPTKCTVLYL
ncbi:hypothetical protein [Tateyamaria pelophila]|uniref:hypothetical protein n=1 Tax=Tateyamaria pelophila TaxID=328415 RepID=UPI001CBC0DEF|nr:hypothetical protein [Tateyamaria pelophila]